MLRAVRLIRVFRLLKIGRYLRWMQVFGKTLTSSIPPLLMLVFIISISILLFSTVVYYAERGHWVRYSWLNDTAAMGGPGGPGPGGRGGGPFDASSDGLNDGGGGLGGKDSGNIDVDGIGGARGEWINSDGGFGGAT